MNNEDIEVEIITDVKIKAIWTQNSKDKFEEVAKNKLNATLNNLALKMEKQIAEFVKNGLKKRERLSANAAIIHPKIKLYDKKEKRYRDNNEHKFGWYVNEYGLFVSTGWDGEDEPINYKPVETDERFVLEYE